MLEGVVQQGFLVSLVVPADRLIQHHEKEAVQRLGEEGLEESLLLGGRGIAEKLLCQIVIDLVEGWDLGAGRERGAFVRYIHHRAIPPAAPSLTPDFPSRAQ